MGGKYLSWYHPCFIETRVDSFFSPLSSFGGGGKWVAITRVKVRVWRWKTLMLPGDPSSETLLKAGLTWSFDVKKSP